MRFNTVILIFTLLCCCVPAAAQESEVPNPFLVLVRDPAVHADLKLTPTQRGQIQTLTDQLDIPMWKMRGLRREPGFAELERLIKITDSELGRILSPTQNARFHQIVLRAQRLEGLFRKDVTQILKLTDQQHSDLRAMIESTQKQMNDLEALRAQGQSESEVEIALAKINQQANDRLKEILSTEQQQAWGKLMGPTFDLNKLGDVRYKAPEFAPETPWIQSPPLSLAGLKGKVVVIHYMAYG